MKRIILGVLAAHGLILIACLLQHWITLVPPKRKVTVNMVHIVAPAAQKPVIIAKKTTPVPVKKTPVVAKKQQAKKILKEIEDTFTAVAAPSIPKKMDIEIPVAPVEHTPVAIPSSEILVAFLQEVLQLPEFGEVKANLSIDRFGKLQSLEILETKSKKNSEFLKNQLPTLQFPTLNETVSLTIVFSNAL